jgi:hypothetical protein
MWREGAGRQAGEQVGRPAGRQAGEQGRYEVKLCSPAAKGNRCAPRGGATLALTVSAPQPLAAARRDAHQRTPPHAFYDVHVRKRWPPPRPTPPQGQEEIGSPDLAAFLREHRGGLLAGVDLALSADGSQISKEQPGIATGLRCGRGSGGRGQWWP